MRNILTYKVDGYMKIRNKSAHQGYSSQKQEDVVEYVEYVLDYLITEPDEIVNYPKLFDMPNAKDELSSEQNNKQKSSDKKDYDGIELTPVDERKTKLLKGEMIIVVINSVVPGENKGEKGYYYYYSIDSNSNKEEGAFVAENRTQYHVGDIIKVRYTGCIPYIFALVSSNHKL